MEGGEGFDWRKDAMASHDLAIAAQRAERFGIAVRHAYKGQPIQAVVHNGAGQWAVIDLDPRHALTLARQLVEFAARELFE